MRSVEGQLSYWRDSGQDQKTLCSSRALTGLWRSLAKHPDYAQNPLNECNGLP